MSSTPPIPVDGACSLSQEGPSRRPGLTYKGAPGGFFKVADPLIERALEHQVRADLETLKDLLEARSLTADAANGAIFEPHPVARERTVAAEIEGMARKMAAMCSTLLQRSLSRSSRGHRSRYPTYDALTSAGRRSKRPPLWSPGPEGPRVSPARRKASRTTFFVSQGPTRCGGSGGVRGGWPGRLGAGRSRGR